MFICDNDEAILGRLDINSFSFPLRGLSFRQFMTVHNVVCLHLTRIKFKISLERDFIQAI